MKISTRIPIELQLDESRPLGAQLRDALREMIVHGRLERGVRFPSSRDLAGRLSISRNTVLYAYEEMEAEGLLQGRVGSGTRVGEGVRAMRCTDPDGLTLEFFGPR